MTAVEPGNAKVGDMLTVTGENLDKASVSEIYLTDGSKDYKGAMTTKTAKVGHSQHAFKRPLIGPEPQHNPLAVVDLGRQFNRWPGGPRFQRSGYWHGPHGLPHGRDSARRWPG